MADELFVQPDELRAAVTEVAAATGALAHARGALESAGGLAAVGLDHAGRADDKVATFVRQWRSELDLVAGMLDAFREVLARAADCYDELDGGLARCVQEAGG
jgi:ABC-type transporter Mla subunit MlaD